VAATMPKIMVVVSITKRPILVRTFNEVSASRNKTKALFVGFHFISRCTLVSITIG